MAMSAAERLKRKREAEAKRRKKIYSDPVLKAEEYRKRQARVAKKKEEDKNKKVPQKVKKARRLKWRNDKRRQAVKKREAAAAAKLVASKQLDSTRATSISKKAKKRSESRRVKRYIEVKKMQDENESLKRQVKKYQQRLYRADQKKNSSASPRTVLKKELKRCNISPEVRRKLLFRTAVTIDLKDSCSKMRSPKTKLRFAADIQLKYIKKYRFLSEAKPYFHLSSKLFSPRKLFGKAKRQMDLVKEAVQRFYEDDENSTLAPGKKDTITHKKIKKQKRYLTNSLKYLHKKFCEGNEFVISRSLFCRLRPFWVLIPRYSDRDTCMCIKHENVKLVVEALKRLKVVSLANPDELIKQEMFCQNPTLDCRFRTCLLCADKEINIDLDGFEIDETSFYETWEQSIEGEVKRTVKKKKVLPVTEIASVFSDLLPEYVQHTARIRHQYDAMKVIKSLCYEKCLLIHIDFSENYQCKYGKEIQSIHFGGNRAQVSLHTGVIYSKPPTKKDPPKCFCTISANLNHDPVAIWYHLKSVLLKYPDIEELHFLSDSPSSQYRNQFMFCIMIKKIITLFKKLTHFTWNYSEAGHGKGAPDGVGAVVKRTCDRIIGYNKDISNFDEFSKCVSQEIKNVEITSVPLIQNDELQNEIRSQSIPVKGTMKVHQVRWSAVKPNQLCFNSLSCFDSECRNISCTHHALQSVEFVTPQSAKLSKVAPQPAQLSTEPVTEMVPFQQPDVSSQLELSSWIVVKFDLEEQQGERKWIGQITKIEGGKYFVNFLRGKRTRDFSGFIYCYPEKPDEEWIEENQILYTLENPTPFQRSLKFSKHVDDL